MKRETLEQYIFELLGGQLPGHLYYHNLQHTKDVLRDALLLCDAERAEDSDIRIITTAALLHDTGFIKTTVDHESISCEFARNILPEYDFDANSIDCTCELIMATKTPQHPKTKAAAILCDADLFYLGTDKFKEYGDNLYRELRALKVIDTYEVWNRKQVQFLSAHRYFTGSAKRMLDSRKLENLNNVKAAIL